jgi:hypothetical protein
MLNTDFNNNFPEDEMDEDDDQINSATKPTTAAVMNDPLALSAEDTTIGHIPKTNDNKNHKEQNCKIVGLTSDINNYTEKQIDGKTVVFYQVQIGF